MAETGTTGEPRAKRQRLDVKEIAVIAESKVCIVPDVLDEIPEQILATGKPRRLDYTSRTRVQKASLGDRLTFIRRKLFTNHDRWNVHKIFGIGCLLHFLYRFCQSGPSDMGFASDWLTLFGIVWHGLLSLSSMIFALPAKRFKEGSMIWPEYRLHSITFAVRSLCCMLIVWLESRYEVGPCYLANILVVLGTLKIASLGSESAPSGTHMKAGSGTIRDLDAPVYMRTFFSVLQFHATVRCLHGERRYSTQFMYVWIIQFTAFLFTLRRKNIAPHMALVSTYGLMLVSGFIVASYEIALSDGLQGFLITNAMGNGAAFLRMIVKVDKYVLWLGFSVLVCALRTAEPALALSSAAYALSLVGVAYIFTKKAKSDKAADKPLSNKEEGLKTIEPEKKSER
jgi:hypothetical protein